MALPGLTPRSPLTTVGPVLVTAEPARTAKYAAVFSGVQGGPVGEEGVGVGVGLGVVVVVVGAAVGPSVAPAEIVGVGVGVGDGVVQQPVFQLRSVSRPPLPSSC